jgi:hypothetical protein
MRSADFLRHLGGVSVDLGELLPEGWFRWSAHGFEPTTDVYLGMSFTAVMPGIRRAGDFGIPSVYGKFGFSTSNYEPVNGVTGHESTDFTSEFLYCCHAFASLWWARDFASIIETHRLDKLPKECAVLRSTC